MTRSSSQLDDREQQVDLTNCDREPIHIPSRVQSFGALVSVTTDWIINHLSENAQEFLEVDKDIRVGLPLAEIFSEDAIHSLRGRLQYLVVEDSVERLFDQQLTETGPAFDIAIHRSGRSIVIEVERGDDTSKGDYLGYLKPMIARIERSATVQHLCDAAAAQVKAITQFDRVMIYRFRPDDSGEVIAEACNPDAESFKGLRYPASDIPKQARALYKRNLLRIIADVHDEGVPVLPVTSPEGEPLDLSLSTTRAVSPIHLEYLRNMGVGASMSISIIVRDRLWGLIACHHNTPKTVSYPIRSLAELFGQMFALVLDQKESDERAEQTARAQILHDQIMAQLVDGNSLADNFSLIANAIGAVVPFDGIAGWLDGTYLTQGQTPTKEEFSALVPFLNTTVASSVYASHELSKRCLAAEAFADRAAGALAIPVSRMPRDYLVLFRREIAQSVLWAGNPDKPVTVGPNGARLTPRKSFETWKQIVKNQSSEWTELEVRTAEQLRVTLLEVVLRMSDRAALERSRAQDQQELLIAELNHRVRNILNLIRSLIDQSHSSAKDVASFTKVVGGRIHALGQAHDQITRQNWNPASFSELIRTEAQAYLSENADRIRIKGRDVLVAPEAFSVLALVFHEMLTNAMKYGALSDRRGQLEIGFSLLDDRSLEISWAESGGPPVQAPKRRGFGSTIIERSIPFELKGKVDLKFKITGVNATFVVPAQYISQALEELPVQPKLKSDVPTDPASVPRSVLIVEDNMIIALDSQQIFRDLGSEHVAVFSRADEALSAIDAFTFDFALLDFNLGLETSAEVANELLRRSIPFVFATGYGEVDAIVEQFKDIRILQKPYGNEEIAKLLRNLG